MPVEDEDVAASTTAQVEQTNAPPEDYAAYRAARLKTLATNVEAEQDGKDEPAAGDKPAESAPEPGPEKDKTQEQPKPKPSAVEKRIAQLTKAWREEERRREELERRLAEATSAKPAETPGSSKADGRPVAEAFDSYEEYIEALTDWKLEQKEKARAAEVQRAKEQEAEATRRRIAEAFEEKMNAAVSKYPDFIDALDADIPMSEAMMQMMVVHPHGLDVAYYLAKNPSEAARISELVPTAAAREFEKIVASLNAPASKETKPITKAPKPPSTVGGGAGPASHSITDEKFAEDYSAWEKARRRQLMGK